MGKRVDEKADWTATGADFTKAGAVGVPVAFVNGTNSPPIFTNGYNFCQQTVIGDAPRKARRRGRAAATATRSCDTTESRRESESKAGAKLKLRARMRFVLPWESDDDGIIIFHFDYAPRNRARPVVNPAGANC